MEGLIPFVYRAIVEYKNANKDHSALLTGCWLSDSPSASYIRLPAGDSGRFEAPDVPAFASLHGFGFSPSAASAAAAGAASASPVIMAMPRSGALSPVRRRSVAA